MYNDKKSLEDKILSPIYTTGKSYYIFMLILLVIVAFGAFAWITQLQNGLGVTGLNDRVFWGIYVSNFIFFIGISYSGTLISAALRLTDSEWRMPLTRMAEAITVIGILIGFSMIIIDMGKPEPERIFFVVEAFRIESPLFWDMLSVSTYLTWSIFFFYLPLIPDLAILRDRHKQDSGLKLRYLFYKIFAFGWHGSNEQRKHLERSISIMSIAIIPIAITCHTVIAFIFAMTWRVGWHSTIFGPYFVVAAIFSGTAAIVVVITIIRKVYHFEEILTYRHFRNLGWILFSFLATYFYLTLTEYFTTAYRGLTHDIELLEEMFFGSYALQFWTFVIIGMVIPGIILLIACLKYNSEKSIWAMFIASIMIILGMWVKRFVIIVPALARPFVETEWTTYTMSWVEWAITLAAGAGFIFAYALLIKIIPLISIWEMEEEMEKEVNKAKLLSSSD